MFKFVTKQEYWDVFGSGILSDIITRPHWDLKSLQDGIAYGYLREMSNMFIGEIGGGNSRLLPTLAKRNKCYNIDEFKGSGLGPKKEIKFEGVENILAMLGKDSSAIKDEQFDVIFSVSVVEHVRIHELPGFFKDCHRILKPSGLMLHLIDVYLEDRTGDNKEAVSRVSAYRPGLDGELFNPLEPPVILSDSDVFFSTCFASNPDNIMEKWNHVAPLRKEQRARAQGCALLMAGRKTGR
ncbi:MAG: class I SAM-dependent methyltransferase [bacterium]|nr:class I SAM-dependent methyltransferase [bacterium]